MNDMKFAAEYRKSVDSLSLPVDYKDKILSGLKGEDKLISFEDKKENKNKNKFRVFLSAVAAVLVVALGITLMFSLRVFAPATKEVRLSVACATNLSNLSGARIVFRTSSGELLKDKKGETVTAVTDAKGEAYATIPASEEYIAQITMEGYIPLEDSTEKGNFYLSPVMDENTYRAVLTWNKECDLDAHLSITAKNTTEKLNYFNSDIENDRGEVVAALDVDNESGDGPETITFNATDDMYIRYSVASYSALKDGGISNLSDTGAQVTLYRGENCIGTYSVDEKSQGNTWCVFEIDNSQLEICNEIYSVSAITEIK